MFKEKSIIHLGALLICTFSLVSLMHVSIMHVLFYLENSVHISNTITTHEVIVFEYYAEI